MGNAKSAVTEPDGNDTSYRWPFLRYISTTRLILGPVTVLLVWIVGFQLLTVLVGIALLALAFPTTLLEFSWLISKCTFCRPEGIFCKFWHFFLRLDTWKRGAFYFGATIVCFALAPFSLLMGTIVGLCYLVLAVCYVLKTFQHTTPQEAVSAGLNYSGNMGQPNVTAYGGGMGTVPDPNRFASVPP